MPSLEMPPRQYPSLGRCIFCLNESDATDMTAEHIIPSALSGKGEMLIERGSCKTCNQEMNERFEQKAMAADFNTARILLGLKRRNRGKKYNKALTLPRAGVGDLTTCGTFENFDTELSPETLPNFFSLMMFRPAGKLVGLDRGGDLSSPNIVFVCLERKPKEASDLTLLETRNHTAFALTIAKIAYCFAVAEIGLDGFDCEEIRALLTGRRDDVYNFVGGLFADQHFTKQYLHKLYLKNRGDMLTVVVHLFASCNMSPYEVVVGSRQAAASIA